MNVWTNPADPLETPMSEALEDPEQPEMESDCDAEDEAAGLPIGAGPDQPTGRVANRRTECEQEAETPIPLRVKIIAGDDQHRFFRREAGAQRCHRRRDYQEEQ